MDNVDRKHRAIRLLAVMIVMIGAGLMSTTTWAQAQGENASIIGVVTDKSGAVISNATVTVTSPALQVPQLTGSTDAGGNYKFVELPAPGVYKLTFAAAGFGTMVKEGITLTVGFTAKIDTVMPVGATTAEVVVTTEGPVIDTVSTSVTSTLEGETLTLVPKPLGMQDILSMAAGVALQGSPDVGDSSLAADDAVMTDGIGVSGSDTDTLQSDLRIEGMNTLTGHESDGRVYLDSMAISEAEFKTSGNNAEVGLPGVAEEAVMKSGGNTFHGDAQGDFERPGFQSNNITAAEAAPPNNLKFGNPIVGDGYYDYAADIGGRIIRNKLWFYGGLDKQLINEGSPSFKGGPDASGCWTCADAPNATFESFLPQYDGKFDYQLSKSTKLVFSELYATKNITSEDPSPTRPLPADEYELQPGKVWAAQVNTVISPRMVVVGEFGYAGYKVDYEPEPVSQIGQFGFTKGAEFAGSPSEEELTNDLYTGPFPTLDDSKPQNRYETPITFTYIPANPHLLGGHHQFAFGTDDAWESAGSQVLHDNASGDYLLEFDNGVPDEIIVYNFPIPTSISDLRTLAFYATDTWTIKRFALDLGVRFDRFHAFNPTQTKPAGQFADIYPAATFPEQDLLTWTDVVPRIGASWDVAGNGKTVVKGFFGMFGDTPGDAFGEQYESNAQSDTVYAWPGPCQATAALAPVEYQCDATSAFLASLPSLTPISATGGISEVINASLKQDKIYEYDASVERQVASDMAVTLSYVHHGIYNLYPSEAAGVDVGHVYNIPVTFTEFNGNPITLYTYAKGSGKLANEQLNTPSSRPDTYNTIMIGFAKRTTARWAAAGSFWGTNYHRWINGTANLYGDPNSWFYPIDNTFNWGINANVYYNLPWRTTLSSFLTMASGTPGQQTEVFSSSALTQKSETVNVSPYGQFRGPVINNLSVKAAKDFAIHERYHVEGNVQVFNLLNSSAAVSTDYLTGATTFGVIETIVSPRVVRFGTKFWF